MRPHPPTAGARVPGSERLIVVVGPSGAGKDAVLQAWQAVRAAAGGAALHLARRSITRAAHAGGEAHEALSPAAWAACLDAGEFALHWHANGLDYGVRHAALAPLRAGRWVLLNGSRAALPGLHRLAPQARVVHITAPTEVLARRLAQRGRESPADIAARLQRAPAAVHAELTLHNDGPLSVTVAALNAWWLGLQVRTTVPA